MSFLPVYDFLNEAKFITLKNGNKNEFMNEIVLKSDFEIAKRDCYVYKHCMLSHLTDNKFELRTAQKPEKIDIDQLLELINYKTVKLKFKSSATVKKNKLGEYCWILIGKII